MLIASPLAAEPASSAKPDPAKPAAERPAPTLLASADVRLGETAKVVLANDVVFAAALGTEPSVGQSLTKFGQGQAAARVVVRQCRLPRPSPSGNVYPNRRDRIRGGLIPMQDACHCCG